MSESSNDFDTKIEKGTDDIKPNIGEGKKEEESEEDVNASMKSEIVSSSESQTNNNNSDDIKTRLRRRTKTNTTTKNSDYVVLSSSDEDSNDSPNNNDDMSTGEEHEDNNSEYIPAEKKFKRKSPRAPSEPVPCLYCSSDNTTFPTEKELNIHIKEQHASEPPAYCCEECDKRFKNNVFLHNHRKRIHNYKYVSKNNRRVKKKRGPKKKKERKSRARFGCDFPGCTTRYDTEKALEKHKKLHENETSVYNCPVCSEPYPNKFALSCHMGWKHPDNSARYPCRIKYRVFLPDGQKAMKRCKASFATKSELFKHRRKQHAPKDTNEQQKQPADTTIDSEQSSTTTITKEDAQIEPEENNQIIITTSNDINNISINIINDYSIGESFNNSSIISVPSSSSAPVKKRPYPCLINSCTRSFATARTRANHMEINHGIKYS